MPSSHSSKERYICEVCNPPGSLPEWPGYAPMKADCKDCKQAALSQELISSLLSDLYGSRDSTVTKTKIPRKLKVKPLGFRSFSARIRWYIGEIKNFFGF